MYRVSQPRILSESEMLVNGFVEYGEYEELRDFKLTDITVMNLLTRT